MPESERPSTATVLFTDLVSSTELRVELGEERADQLRRDHDELLREVVDRNGGSVVKGAGDGMMAAFAAASDALTAAVEAQQALASYSHSRSAVAPLTVRMGLSVGDVSWEGGDCFGTPVVEAARLEAAAEAGQILCSDLVRMLARGRGGHEFESIGFLELKGLPEPLPTCEVLWQAPHEEGHSPQLPLPSAISLSAEDRVFVGRDAEIDEIERFLVREGLRLVWLVGEPGAGKTRLASKIAERLHSEGGVVLFGRCDAEIRTPYRPFVEALTQLTHHLAVDELRALVGPWAGELVRLVPELEHLLSVHPSPDASEAEVGRWRLLEAIRGVLSDLGRRAPVLVVIDDIHWATESTVQTLGHLVRSSEPPSIAVVATIRDTEHGNEALHALIAELAEAPHNLDVPVGGLLAGDVAALAAQQDMSLEPEEIAELLDSTAGNALFVRTLLRSGEGAPASRSVQAVVRRRLSRLGEPTRVALRVASTLGLEADARIVAAALGEDLPSVVEALDDAHAAGLLDAGVGSMYRFVHALVRDALRAELTQAAQALLHLRVAEALDQEPRLVPSLSALAHHWRSAVPAGADIDRVVEVLTEAAHEAERQHDWEQAVDLLRDGIELAGGLATSVGRDLALRAGAAMRKTAVHTDSALVLLDQLARACWDCGDDELAAAAVIEHSWTRVYSTLDSSDALDLTGQARRRPPTSADDRLLIDGYHAVNLARMGRLDEADELWLAAIQAARDCGAVRALQRILGYAHHTALTPEKLAGRYAMLREGYELAEQAGDVAAACETMVAMAQAAMAAGRHAQVRSQLESLLASEEAQATQGHHYAAGTMLVPMLLADGEFRAAEEFAEQQFLRGQSLSIIDEAGIYGVQMFAIRRAQGRLGQLLPLMRRILESGETVWRAGVAALAAAAGDVAECRAQLEHFLSTGATDLPADVTRTGTIAFLADAAVVARDVDAASTLHTMLAPDAGFGIVMFPVSFGPANTVLAMLSRVMGELDRSTSECDAAIQEAVTSTSPVYEARARLELATTLAERAGVGDSLRAHEEAAIALAIAERVGMADVIERARRLLDVHT